MGAIRGGMPHAFVKGNYECHPFVAVVVFMFACSGKRRLMPSTNVIATRGDKKHFVLNTTANHCSLTHAIVVDMFPLAFVGFSKNPCAKSSIFINRLRCIQAGVLVHHTIVILVPK